MTTVNQVPAMERFLQARGWQAIGPDNQYVSPDGEWRVDIDTVEGYAQLCTWADGEFVFVGGNMESRDELYEYLLEQGAIAWECPNCGDTGGTPKTFRWREFQGCLEHGGTVEFEEEGCTKCL